MHGRRATRLLRVLVLCVAVFCVVGPSTRSSVWSDTLVLVVGAAERPARPVAPTRVLATSEQARAEGAQPKPSGLLPFPALEPARWANLVLRSGLADLYLLYCTLLR